MFGLYNLYNQYASADQDHDLTYSPNFIQYVFKKIDYNFALSDILESDVKKY